MISDTFFFKEQNQKALRKTKKQTRGNPDFSFYRLFIVLFRSVRPVKKKKNQKPKRSIIDLSVLAI